MIRYQIPTVIVMLLVLAAGSCLADDLQALKAAAERYVTAMRLVLGTQKNPECSKIMEQAENKAPDVFGRF